MKVRFAVGTPVGPRSSIWSLWRHTNRKKSDVFLAPRSMGGALKVSFHQSGENRDAFTREYQLQRTGSEGGGSSRVRTTWMRAPFSSGGLSRLYQVCIPHSELRAWPLERGLTVEDVRWIPASPQRAATFIELMITQPGRTVLELKNVEAATEGPLAHWYLPTGENFLAIPRYGDLDDVTKGHIAAAVARIPASIDRTPSPGIRLNLTTEPKNGVSVTVETAWPCTVT